MKGRLQDRRADDVAGSRPSCKRRSEIIGKRFIEVDAQEIVDLVDALEGEVNNGGFHQFFYNNAGDNTMEIICGLEAIGAVKVADILKRAAAMFPGGMPPRDRFTRQGVLLATFPDARSFEALNDEFYAYPEDISDLLTSYKSRSGLCGNPTPKATVF